MFLLLVLITVLCSCANAQSSGCRPAKIDLVIVIDSSGSVQHVFNMYITAALDFTKDLTFGPSAAQAAIVQYSKSPPLLKYTFSSPQVNQAVQKAISDLEFLGDTTHTSEAVTLGLSQFDGGRPDAKKVFVLMTDGNSFDPWKVVKETASRVQQSGAAIFIIALGENLYFPELKLYSGDKGALITREDLPKFKSDLLNMAGGCQTPGNYQTFAPVTRPAETLPPVTQPPPQPTYIPETIPPVTYATETTTSTKGPIQCPIPEGYCPCSTVAAATTTTTTTTRSYISTGLPPGYATTALPPVYVSTALPPSAAPTTFKVLKPSSPCAVDILFVLDSSGEDRTNFDKQIRFVLDILDILTIDPNIHLVASVVFDGHMRQKIQFSFTAFTDIQSLSTAITGLPFFGGVSAGGEGLTLARQALRDRRPGVPAVVFVVSNGVSIDDVTGPATALRREPNTEVYAISVSETANKQRLIAIAGDEQHVFIGMNAEKVKNVALGKFLNCPGLWARKIRRRL